MSREVFEGSLRNLAEAVDRCAAGKLEVPALLLAYSAMDIAAHLDCQGKDRRAQFTCWVERYIQPEHNLGCRAIDLYAARCGLVHKYSPYSDLSERGAARPIFYAWRDGTREMLAEMNRLVGYEEAVAVKGEELCNALRDGIGQFIAEVASDPTRSAKTYQRAGKIFGFMATRHGRLIIDQMRELHDSHDVK